jgi:hypothetical protein
MAPRSATVYGAFRRRPLGYFWRTQKSPAYGDTKLGRAALQNPPREVRHFSRVQRIEE